MTGETGSVRRVAAAIRERGVDQVLADLRRAATVAPPRAPEAALLAIVEGQSHQLRPPWPIEQPGYVARQLCLRAVELGEDRIADELRAGLRSGPGPQLLPVWTSRRLSRAFCGELGLDRDGTTVMVALPDGRVVTGGYGGQVLVWDPARFGVEPVELGRHEVRGADEPGPWHGVETAQVTAAVVRPDGRVVTSGADGRVLGWDPDRPGTGTACGIPRGGHDDVVTALAALPDGRLVTGGPNGRVLLWNPGGAGCDPVLLSDHGGQVDAIAVLSDGRVVSGGSEGRLLVADPAGRGPAVQLGRHDGVEALAVLPDGRVVSGGCDDRVRLWDPAPDGAGPIELGRHDDWVRAVAVLPDGRVVSGGNDERLLVWDPARADDAPVELGSGAYWVGTVAVLPDGRVVAPGRDCLLVWDPRRAATPPPVAGHWVGTVAVEPDGRVIAGGYNQDGRTIAGDGRWRTVVAGPGGQPLAGALDVNPTRLGRFRGLNGVLTLPDGRIAGAVGRQLLVVDPAAPTAAPVVVGHDAEHLETVALLPDGRVVTGGRPSGNIDEIRGRILVWDPDRPGTGPVVLGSHPGGVRALAALPDGRVVTVGGDRRLVAWAPAAEPAAEPHAEPVALGGFEDRYPSEGYGLPRVLLVLPDGRAASGGGDGQILIWDPARVGRPPVRVGLHEPAVWDLAALPDGRLVSAGHDGRVLIWDPVESGAAPVELGLPEFVPGREERGPARTVTVLPDGRIASGADDGRILLWDPADAASGPVVLVHVDWWVRMFATLPDGRLVTASFDGYLLAWRIPADPGRHGPDERAMDTAVLPDGRRVTRDAEGRILVWDKAGGTVCATIAGPAHAIAAGPRDHDTSAIVVANRDTGLSYWSIANG